jgi:hypothetical protein
MLKDLPVFLCCAGCEDEVRQHSDQTLANVAQLKSKAEGLPTAPSGPTEGEDVRWVGEMRQVMLNGDLSGHVDLAKLAKLPHLYAVGLAEQLRGEVTICDGKPYISRIENGKMVIDTSFAHKACFLVYAQVARWREISIPASVWITHERPKDFLRFLPDTSMLKKGIVSPVAFISGGVKV